MCGCEFHATNSATGCVVLIGLPQVQCTAEMHLWTANASSNHGVFFYDILTSAWEVIHV